jgi:chemotaxis signal transduction protein
MNARGSVTASAVAHETKPLAADRALHIVVGLGGERFGFPVSHVEEALDAPRIEWVPVAPAGMLGQIVHRGRMVGAWDAAWAFRLAEPARAGAALVLRDGPRRVAIIVDDVIDMARIEPANIQPVPAGADLEGVLGGVCFAVRQSSGKARAGHGLVNVVRVEALVLQLAAQGTIIEGLTS